MNNEKQYIASNQIIEHYKSQIILQKIQIFKPFFTKHTQLPTVCWWRKLGACAILIYKHSTMRKTLKKKPSKSISSMNFSLKVYLCTSERAPTRPAKLEAMVLNSICLSLACSPTWDREQSLFFSIFFVSIMKSFLNRPSDTGYRWKLNCRKQL